MSQILATTTTNNRKKNADGETTSPPVFQSNLSCVLNDPKKTRAEISTFFTKTWGLFILIDFTDNIFSFKEIHSLIAHPILSHVSVITLSMISKHILPVYAKVKSTVDHVSLVNNNNNQQMKRIQSKNPVLSQTFHNYFFHHNLL